MSFFRSFKYAFAGIKKAFIDGRNFRIMTICFALVIVFGFAFGVTATEWILLLICSGLVLSLELINTAIESTLDRISPDYNEAAGRAKDIAAAAVLIASVISAIVALIIFVPYIFGIVNP